MPDWQRPLPSRTRNDNFNDALNSENQSHTAMLTEFCETRVDESDILFWAGGTCTAMLWIPADEEGQLLIKSKD